MSAFIPAIAAILVSLAAAYLRVGLRIWTIAVAVAIIAAGWLAESSPLAIGDSAGRLRARSRCRSICRNCAAASSARRC